MRRKVVLLLIWATTPMIIHYDRSLLGLLEIREGWYGFIHNLSILWLLLGAIAVMFRTIHLFFIMSIQSGLVWAIKILTDPFHDIKLYHKSPIQVLKGELIDPMARVSWNKLDEAGFQMALRDCRQALNISLRILRLIVLLLISGFFHHHPSFCIFSAAEIKHFRTALKSWSEKLRLKINLPVPTQLSAKPSALR